MLVVFSSRLTLWVTPADLDPYPGSLASIQKESNFPKYFSTSSENSLGLDLDHLSLLYPPVKGLVSSAAELHGLEVSPKETEPLITKERTWMLCMDMQ